MAYPATSSVKGKSDPAPKNRVWDFSGGRQRFAYRIDPQALQPCRENRLTPTKTVSDVYVGVNLYAFVGNDGVNLVDYLGKYNTGLGFDDDGGSPSAVPRYSEAEARRVVGLKIGEWQRSGYYFAADLFEHFLHQRGSIYSPSRFNIAEIKQEGKKKMCREIREEVQKNPALAPLNISIKPENANDSNIRWNYLTDNKAMLYAYGGARFFASGCADSNGRGVFKIRLEDTYEYVKDDGWFWDPLKQAASSTFSSAYHAAVYLERNYGYRTFTHKAEFELECSGKE